MIGSRRFAGEEGGGSWSDDKELIHQDKSVTRQWCRHVLPEGESCDGVSRETRVS